MIKKAVILAAGRGTRVQPLTFDLPKPMIPLLGKPVMEYIVEHLARQGVREIMINTSHLSHRIEQYFGDGRRFGVSIGYSFEGHIENGKLIPESVGSAGALRKINDLGGFIDETTAVLCGDAVVDVDLQSAAARHRAQDALATVITKEVAPQDVIVQRLMQGEVTGIDMPGHALRPGVRVGLNASVAWSGSYCVSREGLPKDAPATRWWGDARRRRNSLRGAA